MRQYSSTLGISGDFAVPVFLLCLVTLIASLTALNEAESQGDGKPLEESLQLVIVVTRSWEAVDGSLQRYERPSLASVWRSVGPKIPVVVGRNGMGWGKGLYQNPSKSGLIKKEGDRKAPAGIFSLSQAFGYAPAESIQRLKLPYLELSQGEQCVDDVKSKHYNEIVNANELGDRDWQSFEDMRRSDGLYRWGIVVDHNARPSIPGAGSCVFLHIWRGPSQGTSGCTAFEASQVEAMLHWLDSAAKPVLVQLPTPEYIRLQRQWDLPELP
jgi:L,D-peptidoglycan transpeptidase YkuD (ErfK/YbiS/YcfS/YnhG family)